MKLFNTGFLLRSLLSITLVSAVVAGLHSDLFEVQATYIEEATEVEVQPGTHEVFQHLSPRANEIAEAYHHQNIWWVQVSEIAQKIKDLPGVKDVIVERVPPHSLKITLQPEAIRFLYVTKSGGFYPVTESSKVLTQFKSKLYPDAPITRDEKIIKDSKIRAQAVDLVSSLPTIGLFSQSSVAEIELENKSFWLSLMQPDVKIKMNPENASLKAERVERVLDYTRKHNLHARVIDAEYSKKVVVKLRKDR